MFLFVMLLVPFLREKECGILYYVMLCNRMLYCACAQVKNCSGYHVASWAEKRGKSCLILYEDTTRCTAPGQL